MSEPAYQPTPEEPPIYVRVLDAFQAFYLQLATVDARITAFQNALVGSPPPVVLLAVADLECAWAVLDARMDLLHGLTNDDAARDLWTVPALAQATARVRPLVRAGALYMARHGADADRLIAHLRRLQVRVDVQDRLTTDGCRAAEMPRGIQGAGDEEEWTGLSAMVVPNGSDDRPRNRYARLARARRVTRRQAARLRRPILA